MINFCNRKYMSIGALPSTYQESLSYLEKLELLYCKINEICEFINNISLDFDKIDKLIEEKFNELKQYVDLNDEMLYNYVDNKIEKSKNYSDHKINIAVNELKSLINEKVMFLIDYTENSNLILKNELLDELQELKNQIDDIIIKGINIYDPTTGLYNNIQDVIYNMYKYLRYYGITALDFDNLGLSCKDFEDKNLTARNFDLYSKEKLLINFNHYMFSPFSGKITSFSEVINELANFHKTPISTIEFDNLQLSSNEFDDKNISAYDFDWHGKTLLIN